MPAAFNYTLRALSTHDEFRMVEDVQRRAWNTNDLRDIVPVHVLLTAQKEGGLVAGAFDPAGHMVAFVFGFIGRAADSRFKHCSHMMGVVPEARGGEVGYRLKLFQREYVLAQGFDLVTWTYDPLEGRNAMLNITKLGGIARKYYPNLYGDWADGINQGLATDRFEVEWWVKSLRASARAEGRASQPNSDSLKPLGVPVIDLDTAFDATVLPTEVLVPVPTDFQRLKSDSMDAARAWRAKTARAFSALFGAGYAACEYLAGRASGVAHNYYLLARNVPGLA
jgi:predicted GNAT superfamily acetyltransferase